MPTSSENDAQMGPKIDPKSTPKRPQSDPKSSPKRALMLNAVLEPSWDGFGPVLGRFWVGLGAVLGPFWGVLGYSFCGLGRGLRVSWWVLWGLGAVFLFLALFFCLLFPKQRLRLRVLYIP